MDIEPIHFMDTKCQSMSTFCKDANGDDVANDAGNEKRNKSDVERCKKINVLYSDDDDEFEFF